MNSTQILHAANPIEDTAFADSWADPEGKASFERIVAEPRTAKAKLPRARTGRRLVIGAALAGAAGAAVAIVGLPGAPNHGGAGAAWAVTKNPDGSVSVDVKDYRDPAGLQAKLRAAGLRANVVTAPDSCIPNPGGAELATFDGDASTFQAPYTWQRLFAGSPSYATVGPGYSVVAKTGGTPRTLPDGETFPAHVSFTVHPSQLPPGDDLNIGFGASGQAMVVDVEKTGTPLQCSAPPGSVPSDDGSTPTS